MDSDEEYMYGSDSGNESSDDGGLEFVDSDEENNASGNGRYIEDYPYEVLSTDDITRHMLEVIKDVNSVVNVSIFQNLWN